MRHGKPAAKGRRMQISEGTSSMKKVLLSCAALLIVMTIAVAKIMKRARIVKANDRPSLSESLQFPRWKTGAYKDYAGKESLRSEIFATWGLCGYIEQVPTGAVDYYVLFLVDRRVNHEMSSSASQDVVFVNGFDSLEAAKHYAEGSCVTR